MKKFSTLLACAALATLPTVDAARADTADNLQIFRTVCLANAPAFDEAAIRQIAEKVIYSSGDVSGSASVQWQPNRRCVIRARIGAMRAPVMTVAEVEPIVVEAFNRLGGGNFTMKRVTKDGVRYRMETPAGRFEISFSTDGATQSFWASKI